ncbi:hypothetical protein [Nitrosococcus oceani]|uniref:hypothetical protein n=1 Tax=Nitrosococcus oceani TaxID=1229 RepID=UPI0015819D6F|nr:hypothetical protein [Nitrosococcus oceani]
MAELSGSNSVSALAHVIENKVKAALQFIVPSALRLARLTPKVWLAARFASAT